MAKRFSSPVLRNLPFKTRLLFSVLFVVGVSFLLLVILGLLTGWRSPGQILVAPLLLSLAASLGLAILLGLKIVSPLQKFFRKVQATHSHLLTPDMTRRGLSFLSQYADEVSEELEGKESEITAVRSRMVALGAITAAINQDSGVDQILNEVLATILEVTGFDGGIMFLRPEEEETWDIRAWKGLQLDRMWGAEQVTVDQGVLREAARRQQIIFLSDVEKNQQWQIQEFKDKGIKAILTLPFAAKGKVPGAAVLVSFQPRETSLEENEWLETVGRQLGMAIGTVNLLSDWTLRARNLSLLLETSSAFSASLSPKRTLGTLTERMLKILNADFCCTALADEDGSHIVFETFSSAGKTVSPIRQGEKIALDQLPLYRRVITTNKMIRIRGGGQLASSERQLLPSEEVKELILIPLSKGEEAVGAIGVGLHHPGELSLGDLDLGRSVARQAAIALENARLHENVKEKAEEASSLYRVAQKLSSILKWDELLDEILKVIVESFGYLNSAILLVDKSKGELYVRAAHGFPDETIRNSRIKIGEEGITGWVAHTGRPLVVGDVKKDPRYVMGIRECKSEVAVPVKLKGEIIGVLDAESDKLFAFGNKDVRLLSQLASQIAVVLENSRLFSDERRRWAQLALINDVGRKVVSTLNLDKLLENVIEAIQLSFKYDHVSLFLLDESAGDFILKTCCGSSCDSVKPGCRLKEGVGMVGRAAGSGETVLCNDVTENSDYVPAIPSTRSELSVPIKRGKQVMGVLDIESSTQESFDEQDVAVMETVTDLLATAINNARLYEEAKGKAYGLELTDRINRAISSTLDVKGIFNIVSNELNKIVDCDRITLNFWYPEERLFRLKMSFCPDAGLSAVGSKRIPADETSMFTVIQTEKPLYQSRLSLEAASKPMDRLIFSEGMRSYVYVPVLEREKVIAILGLESRRKNAFGGNQMELLESVGGHLSVAIQNARLFSDLQKAYQNLQKTQKEMIQIERLRALGEMAGGVVHDFNNILASISGRVQLILMKLEKGETEPGQEMKENLQIIERSAEDGARILARIRDFTRAKPEAAFRLIDINRVIEDSVELTKAYWRDRALLSEVTMEVKKELGANGGVMGDAAELRDVVTNMILNALDAMPEGGTLTLKTQEDDDSVLVTVRDTGTGMTEDLKSKIFAPFFTTKGEDGTGLGLSLANGIVTRHRGEISVESTPGSGSTFTIRMPRGAPAREEAATEKLEVESASVLVVEDEENIREVLDEILSTAGHKIIQASDGEEGVELLKRHKPDIVITDLGMPGLSGWDVADAVKAEDPSTPVILFTGWGVKLDETKVKGQNVDRFINKPFNMEQILNLISELLADGKAQGVTR